MPIYRFGTEEQKKEWLPKLTDASGLGAFGLTEPEAGSDAGGTKTNATLENGTWTINGSKCFITNSGTDITRLVTATAVTGTRTSKSGQEVPEISTIMVPTGTPGFTAEPAYDKVGWNSSDTHPLTFDNVQVPEENLLGERGRGYANFLRILDEGRIAVAALSVGAAQGCVDESVKYAKERKAFGKSISDFQGISFKIARMEARVVAARAAYYLAASRMLANSDRSTHDLKQARTQSRLRFRTRNAPAEAAPHLRTIVRGRLGEPRAHGARGRGPPRRGMCDRARAPDDRVGAGECPTEAESGSGWISAWSPRWRQ
jgi:alkylation response protein AidB-like acyl-CoA dehydrogenase